MSTDYRTGALERLGDMLITVDKESDKRLWTDTQPLCDRHKLTAYDAAYLELAMRLRIPIATLDKRLAAAAIAEGVDVIGAVS